ncbi:MAG: helix-turn-helix transcriptional regulator [Lentisphaerae bacterium]|nr:helix-turn-helix transcriptional regulator [Lentisphaerota bacterium]
MRLLLALMLLKSEDVSGNLRGRADAASLIRYLEQHYYRQDLTIAYLAEMAGYSPNYLQKIFAAAAGCRPKEYLQKYRLEMAAKFLRENRYPVKEVAAMCGFSDAHYFANAFRKYYGCTPSEFRISVTPAP